MYTCFFIAFILYYRIKSILVVRNNFDKNITLGDFSIEVTGIPSSGVTEENIREHFEKFGEVHEVTVTKIYDNALNLYKKRADLQNKLNIKPFLMQARDEDVNVEKLKLKKQIKVFDHKIEAKDHRKGFKDLPNYKVAFVVFRTITARDETMKIYKRERKCCRKW